jgi:RNA polymerase sigma factor (sigma-70 family)
MSNNNLFDTNLVYAKSAAIFWCNRTSLEYDDCYQLALVGLFKASKTFEDGRNFKTWAHAHINNEIKNELRRLQHRVSEIHLSPPSEDETGMTIEDFGECDSNFERIENQIAFGKIAKVVKDLLTEREWDILWKIAVEGVEQWKIAEMYGFQQPHVSRIMKGIRRKVTECPALCSLMANS